MVKVWLEKNTLHDITSFLKMGTLLQSTCAKIKFFVDEVDKLFYMIRI